MVLEEDKETRNAASLSVLPQLLSCQHRGGECGGGIPFTTVHFIPSMNAAVAVRMRKLPIEDARFFCERRFYPNTGAPREC